MKNLLVLAAATLFATNSFAAEMKWNGSFEWDYAQQSQNDSLDSKDSVANGKDVSTTKSRMHQYRANLGVMGGWEHVEYGVGIRTNAGVANSDYVTANNAADRAIALEQAWGRYVRDFGSLDLAFTFGRQKPAMAWDSEWQTLLDNDVRFDGFGWNFKFGMFGLNAAQYVLGTVTHSATAGGSALASSGSLTSSSYTYTDSSDTNAQTTKHFAMLYAFQPHMTWKFSDEIEAFLAVAYYRWIDEGRTNQIGGGAGVNGNGAGTVPALANRTFRFDNKTQWDFLAQVSLPFNLNFTADYVKANKATYDNVSVSGYTATTGADVSSSAWTLGLTYGKLRKAQDFTIGYAYTTKGIGSMANDFTNDLFKADNTGHTIKVGYAMADNFHLGFRTLMLQEKERIDNTSATNALGAGSAYAGTNANQKMKTNYWELTAGVAF